MNALFYLAAVCLAVCLIALFLSLKRSSKLRVTLPPEYAIFVMLTDEINRLFVDWQKTLTKEEILDRHRLSKDYSKEADEKLLAYEERYKKYVTDNSHLIPVIRKFLSDLDSDNSPFYPKR